MIKSLCLEQAYTGSSGNGNLMTTIVNECVSMNVCNAIPLYGHMNLRVCACMCVCYKRCHAFEIDPVSFLFRVPAQ